MTINSIETQVQSCIAIIEQRHHVRETALVLSRQLIQMASKSIRAIHRMQVADAQLALAESTTIVDTIYHVTAPYPDLLAAGHTQDALKEFAEAHLVCAFLTGQELPSPTTLRVEPACYLNGLAEAASELRRAMLDGLRRGDVRHIENHLAIMDEVYRLLITVDYPDVLTGGLRRTSDMLRAVLERTRGDVTAALRQEALKTALQHVEQQLTHYPKTHMA